MYIYGIYYIQFVATCIFAAICDGSEVARRTPHMNTPTPTHICMHVCVFMFNKRMRTKVMRLGSLNE